MKILSINNLQISIKANPPVKKAVPTKDELLNLIKDCWKRLDENPFNSTFFYQLRNAEELLNKHYPQEYESYIKRNKLC